MKSIIKTSLFIILSLLSIQSVIGQNSGIRKIKKESARELDRHNDKYRVGYTFSALLNSFVGLQINGAVNISNDLQLNMEAGWIFANSDENISNVSGYRFRPGLRWYFTEKETYRLHISLGYNIRKTKVKKINSFTLSDGTIVPNFQYGQERTLKGPVILFGMDYWLNDSFLIDLGVGIGNGNMLIVDSDTPPNSFKNQFLLSSDSPGESFYLIAILNIKFQYSF